MKPIPPTAHEARDELLHVHVTERVPHEGVLPAASAAEGLVVLRASAGHWSRIAGPARGAVPDADAPGRRAVFDTFAALVEDARALGRRAVALLRTAD
ncbi:hypothetical protein [Streptomyces sp. NPDC093514]|uniref:hypothetical protein n=1 Tax=Streptomyces sp. NPDC093514 TaxID=3366039 RepID=UPI0037F4CF91